MSTNPGVTATGLYPPPFTVTSLGHFIANGMTAIGVLGFMSTVSTISAVLFIGVHLYQNKHARQNQILLLLFNLLVADFIQAAAFLMDLHWVAIGRINAPSAICTAQAAMLNVGDVGSGLSVLAVASWTAWSLSTPRKIAQKLFLLGLAGIWIVAFITSSIGPFIYGRKFYTAAGAWCWISIEFQIDRLYCHYLWVFLTEFLCLLIYAFTAFRLKLDARNKTMGVEEKKIWRRTEIFIALYWVVYMFCTLPLAVGRMRFYAGYQVSNDTISVLGCFFACEGWLDTALYVGSRWRIIIEDQIDPEDGPAEVKAESEIELDPYHRHNLQVENQRREVLHQRHMENLATKSTPAKEPGGSTPVEQLRPVEPTEGIRAAPSTSDMMVRTAGRSSVGKPAPPVIFPRSKICEPEEVMPPSTIIPGGWI